MTAARRNLLAIAGICTGIAALAAGSAPAQQTVQPLPKVGGCPLGYYSSGSYCVSSPSNDREAIQKSGKECPLGWYS